MIRNLLIIVTLAGSLSSACADRTAAPRISAAQSNDWSVVRVYDGDTFMVRVPDLPEALNPVSIRVRGVDAPEIGTRARCATEASLAEKARDATEAFLARGPHVIDQLGWDKYGGRIDARVTVNGVNLADALIAQGLGRPYDGGKRVGWCG